VLTGNGGSIIKSFPALKLLLLLLLLGPLPKLLSELSTLTRCTLALASSSGSTSLLSAWTEEHTPLEDDSPASIWRPVE
jgi:hypothetical protein